MGGRVRGPRLATSAPRHDRAVPASGLLAGGPACVGLVSLIGIGSLVLWLGVPTGWLWVASRLQEVVSLTLALSLALAGATGSVVAIMRVLLVLDHVHGRARAARGVPVAGTTALETLCVAVGGAAVVGFVVWFLGFAGASPLPLLGIS